MEDVSPNILDVYNIEVEITPTSGASNVEVDKDNGIIPFTSRI